MRLSEFDYDLPDELIAHHPLPRRDDSRMMVVERTSGKIRHGTFADFPGFLEAGDLLVLNDTRVIPARIWGSVGDSRIEFLFIRETEPGLWAVLCRPARRVRMEDLVRFSPGVEARVAGAGEEGLRLLRFRGVDVRAELERSGFAPLPPYIKRTRENADLRAGDLERYQTVFARKEGAVAAPTAGLHFTKESLVRIFRRGALVRFVTLEVGMATFQPVRTEDVAGHRMLEENYEIPRSAAGDINLARAEGRQLTAVGTTVVRALESAWMEGGIRPGRRSTDLFIRPGYEFRAVDRLLTNFHLPKSTLLMLVAAFAGLDLVRTAYREAVRERYRFFSYGDCMLVL